MQVAILGKTGMNGRERREPRCRGCGPWNLPGEWAHLGRGYALVTNRPHTGALRKTDAYSPLINSPHTARPALRNRLELWLFLARTQIPVSWPCHLLGCCPWLQDCSQIMRCHWTRKRVQGSKFLLEQVRQEWRIPLLFAFHGWQLAMWPHPATGRQGCVYMTSVSGSCTQKERESRSGWENSDPSLPNEEFLSKFWSGDSPLNVLINLQVMCFFIISLDCTRFPHIPWFGTKDCLKTGIYFSQTTVLGEETVSHLRARVIWEAMRAHQLVGSGTSLAALGVFPKLAQR